MTADRSRDRRLRVANSATRGPAVRAVLLVQLDVDGHQVARLPRDLRGVSLPPHTSARIDAGRSRRFVDFWGEIGTLVQDCAAVEIVGTEPEGIAAVLEALSRALRAEASDAC